MPILIFTALLLGCASTSPSSKVIPIPPLPGLLDGLTCQSLVYLDTLVAAEIEETARAYDKLFQDHATHSLSSSFAGLGSALSVPGSPAHEIGKTTGETADRNAATAFYFLKLNGPQLATRLRVLKGMEPAIAEALKGCNYERP